jgi:hypothetical protein
MYYSVLINSDDPSVQHYFNGSEKHYLTQQEAQEYLESFESWEQDLLQIESFPF